jgi:hypothetical protein
MVLQRIFSSQFARGRQRTTCSVSVQSLGQYLSDVKYAFAFSCTVLVSEGWHGTSCARVSFWIYIRNLLVRGRSRHNTDNLDPKGISDKMTNSNRALLLADTKAR